MTDHPLDHLPPTTRTLVRQNLLRQLLNINPKQLSDTFELLFFILILLVQFHSESYLLWSQWISAAILVFNIERVVDHKGPTEVLPFHSQQISIVLVVLLLGVPEPLVDLVLA